MARAEGVRANPVQCDVGVSTIVYGAPSCEAAEQWGRRFVERMILADHPELRLAEIKVLPVHERLLTPEGQESIDWPRLVEDARRVERSKRHPIEFHSTLMFYPPNRGARNAPEWDVHDLESMKKRVANAEQWNWETKKQFYYLLYHEKRAFIVQAINMLVASQPFTRAVCGTADGDYNVSVIPWPCAENDNE